ncbi:hypothetical protein KKG41_01225 [Patescibacteria group bacterium]|nr:hypothetical protein [Patescibacteria group bacterium]MBU1890434.1 hypothetical protein [Patescibacteria group bacterium]
MKVIPKCWTNTIWPVTAILYLFGKYKISGIWRNMVMALKGYKNHRCSLLNRHVMYISEPNPFWIKHAKKDPRLVVLVKVDGRIRTVRLNTESCPDPCTDWDYKCTFPVMHGRLELQNTEFPEELQELFWLWAAGNSGLGEALTYHQSVVRGRARFYQEASSLRTGLRRLEKALGRLRGASENYRSLHGFVTRILKACEAINHYELTAKEVSVVASDPDLVDLGSTVEHEPSVGGREYQSPEWSTAIPVTPTD